MRTGRLKKILGGRGFFPYLVTDLFNIKYLTGYSGSNATIIVDEKKSFFISDSRYEEYARSILPKNYKFILQSGSISDAVKSVLAETGKMRLFLESRSLNLQQFLDYKKSLKGIKLTPVEDDPVQSLRMIKDMEEINILKEAADITDRCFYHLLEYIKPGLTEWEVAVEIETYYKKNGCTACSFDPIVASGAGSSMPHYMPSMTKKISRGDVLLIDMGCVYKGYNSDLTRTVFTGKIDSRLEKIYHIVQDAQARALNSAKPGMDTDRLDAVARSYITESGYGENFGHGLGHGVGIEIHEMPSVKKIGSIKLKRNMVFTIEPGIYIPGLGGVRIEDMVLVTAAGSEALTQCSKELIVI
jgi:Xaa-Pro aminopeptidase